jgi:hypothetical protein
MPLRLDRFRVLTLSGEENSSKLPTPRRLPKTGTVRTPVMEVKVETVSPPSVERAITRFLPGLAVEAFEFFSR